MASALLMRRKIPRAAIPALGGTTQQKVSTVMKVIDRTTYILATAAILSVVVFAQMPAAAAADQAPLRLASTDASKSGHASVDRVEARIADLHKKLHITADQTAQWNDFAAVMRENAKMAREVIEDKSRNAATMSAVDDLQAYKDLAQAHVDGLTRMIPAFEALYATMSDSQKKTADAMFAPHGRHDQRSSSK